MRTRIYTRSKSGEVLKFDVEGKLAHADAKASLKEEKIQHNGAIMLVYFKH